MVLVGSLLGGLLLFRDTICSGIQLGVLINCGLVCVCVCVFGVHSHMMLADALMAKPLMILMEIQIGEMTSCGVLELVQFGMGIACVVCLFLGPSPPAKVVMCAHYCQHMH